MTTQPCADPDPPATPTEHDRISLSLRLLWGERQPRARGPKPGLSLDQIVETAITVADAEGLAGLSMRRVSRELGVGTMTLYRYVPGKAELLDLMLDRVCAPHGRAETGDWRAVLAGVVRGSRDLYLAHPWLLQVNWTRPVIGPNALAGLEVVVGALEDLGLSDQECVTAMIMIDGFAVGFARSQLLSAAAAEETGISDEEFWARHYPILEKAMMSGDYPAMARLSEDAFSHGWDDSFEWGLHRLLDGIEALIESRRR